MSIRKNQRGRHGALPPQASGPVSELRDAALRRTTRAGRSPSARTNGGFTQHAGGPAPADLSQYRASRARGRVGNLQHPETPVGLELVFAAFSALRDEFTALRRDLTTPVDLEGEILTMAGVTQLLGVSSKTVVEWHHKFGLPGVKVGRPWRFRRSEVVRWIGEHHVR